MKTPKRKVISVVCSECGLDWEDHGDKPTLEDCVRLLREALDSRPSVTTITYDGTQPYTFGSATNSAETA